LTELEIKLSYQEDLIQSLNQAVVDQQRQIERLEAMMKFLYERLENLPGVTTQGNQPADEKPPHY
jgi:SlyX protein